MDPNNPPSPEAEAEPVITCWCGVRGTASSLFDNSVYSLDQCVCHNHGEAPCPGCEECAVSDDDDYDYEDD